MTTFESLVLGVVQGVTEFLPISSTAHLRIVPALTHWPDPGAAYTAVLQLGSLLAVIGYFLPDLLRMLRAALAALTDRSRPPQPGSATDRPTGWTHTRSARPGQLAARLSPVPPAAHRSTCR